MHCMIRFLFFALLIGLPGISQTIRFRSYKKGETSVYKLTSESFNNGSYTGKSVSTAQMTVVKEDTVQEEEIIWLSKKIFTKKDTLNSDSTAKAVEPYRISLLPGGKVLLPPLTIPDMVGDITDFNTFFVAIAPDLHMHRLSAGNKEWLNDKLVKGNFGDGTRILFGRDYIQVNQHLLSISRKEVVVRTDFMPPPVFSMDTLLADTILHKSFDQPNNFVMIQRGTGDKVNLLWGVEQFSITSRINNKNGQLIEASMTNTLQLRMRYNCTADLKNYAAEFPVKIERKIKLERVE